MSRLSRLWRMFYTMLYISAFTFGGGFVIVSLMKKKYVDEYGWLSEEEMLDLTALAQSSPGAIAVNAAILTGYRMEGILGVIASVLGTVIPPVTTLSVISLCYGIFRDSPLVQAVLKGMQAGVAAVICDVVLDLSGKVVKTKVKVKGKGELAHYALAPTATAEVAEDTATEDTAEVSEG